MGGSVSKERRGSAQWRLVAAVACLAVLGALGCAPGADEAEEAEEGLEPAADPTEGAGTLEAVRWLADFATGGVVDPQGAIPAESARDEFGPGETVYVSMAVADAPAEAAVHVIFYDSSGRKVAEDEKKVPAGARYLYFDSGDTANWAPGAYRVEIAVDGEVVDEKELTLVPGES